MTERLRRRAVALLAPLLLAAGLAACGGAGEGDAPALTVSAAASLKTALTGYAEGFDGATVRLQFAGSDTLAAQLRRGARPDVLLSADRVLPAQLHREELVEQPLDIATNELVLAVPAGDTGIGRLQDLARPGVRLAIGRRGVPVGDYAHRVIGALPARTRAAILANVRSEEPEVTGIVGKLTQRAVDAGFVYRSDVAASGGRLRAITLPERLRPRVRYAGAVVSGTAQPRLADRFLRGLRGADGRRALRAAGLGGVQ